LSGYVDADGRRRDALEAEAVGGDDSIMEDIVDVRLGSESAKSAGVVFRKDGLDCGDAKVFVAPGEMGAGGGDAGFGIAGDGRVAIEDEVAVGSDAVGVDLGTGESGQTKRQDECSPKDAMADRGCSRCAKSGRREN
jgi:hypothetical protein